MPVIQTYDPAAAAVDVIGSALQTRREDKLRQAAQNYQESRDRRTDLNADRDYALRTQQFGLEQQRAASELQTAEQQRRISAANEDFEKTMRPLRAEYQRLQN